jgi:GTP-binding protein Era
MKAGFVAIMGAPNVGKSTFLNQVLGLKLAITSDKPQTTRHRLLGIHNLEGAQIVFLDTPGLHQADRALNKLMMDAALSALEGVDAILFMADVTREGMAASKRACRLLSKSPAPMVLALNKIDLLPRKEALFPLLDRAASWADFKAVIPISALSGDGTAEVLKELVQSLPPGEAIFPQDMITDLSLRFLAAELIREKVFRLTRQEIPYATAVTVDQFLEPAQEGGTTSISATIHVERPGQKGIVIGKSGAMLKEIGSQARKDMETLIGGPVFLDLFVRVEPKWSLQAKGLRKVGYSDQKPS